MNEEETLGTIAELAKFQGFYGWLIKILKEIKENDPELYDVFLKNASKWEDATDLVMSVECGL